MVVFDKLRLDVTAPFKGETREDIVYASLNLEGEPVLLTDPINSAEFQPHEGTWKHERLAVASGSKVHIIGIQTNRGRNTDDLKKWLEGRFEVVKRSHTEFRRDNISTEHSREAERRLSANVGFRNVSIEPPLDHLLLSTINAHGKFPVQTVRWAPSGICGASLDASAVQVWFYEGSAVRSFNRDPAACSSEPLLGNMYTTVAPGAEIGVEQWTCKAQIRCPSGSEWLDFCFAGENLIAAASLDRLCLYSLSQGDTEESGVVRVHVEGVLHVAEGHRFLGICASACGEFLAAMVSDNSVKIWRFNHPRWMPFGNISLPAAPQPSDCLAKLARMSFDITGGVLAIPMGRPGTSNVGLLLPLEELRRVQPTPSELPQEGRPDLLFRLRGHVGLVSGIWFGPTLFGAGAPPVFEGDAANHPLITEIKNRARLCADWPSFSFAAMASVDGTLSFWRVFQTEPARAGSNKDIKVSGVAAACTVVLAPRYLDEQGLATDVAWQPDGLSCVIVADDGSLTNISFDLDEVQGDVVGRRTGFVPAHSTPPDEALIEALREGFHSANSQNTMADESSTPSPREKREISHMLPLVRGDVTGMGEEVSTPIPRLLRPHAMEETPPDKVGMRKDGVSDCEHTPEAAIIITADALQTTLEDLPEIIEISSSVGSSPPRGNRT